MEIVRSRFTRGTVVATSSLKVENSAVASRERALNRALAAAQTAHENRAREIVVLDLRELTTEFDYFVIATGSSTRQLHAISEEIDHKLEDDLRDRRLGVEGYQTGGWILLDYGDIIIHLFDGKTRDYYRLDELWTGAKRVPFTPKDPAK
ncbi:MAG: ribosome silencing factor [Planctomycetia bacterium]|nr:ribosome silencing factor [Planctomycetia bacterium]